jgi:LuxR family maltose regulon positive regulatory protein
VSAGTEQSVNPSKFLPPAWSAVLERERLLDKLAAWGNRKLVLIHGPAGQGKSTLAATYARTIDAPTIWYSLDANDNDPAVLFEGIARALQQAPGAAGGVPPPPRPRYGTGDPAQAFLRWFNDVVQHIPAATIVFDDFPVEASQGSLQQVLLPFIEASPPTFRFLIISRARPEIDVGQLRAKRQLGEISGDELRFTSAEVTALFSTVFGMPVRPKEASHFHRMTEGWATSLVLLHEYLTSRPDEHSAARLPAFPAAEFRDHVFEYLAREVFAHLSPALQDFLLRTSVPDHLPLLLAGLLSGLPVGNETGGKRGSEAPTVPRMVGELRRRNLFLSVVDAAGETLRYHALFREFLLRQLTTRVAPPEVKRLQVAAAGYFSRQGDEVRAVELLLASGRPGEALRRIERAGRGLIARGRAEALLRLLDAMPADFRERPWPVYYRAVACRFTKSRRALELFDRAYDGFRKAGDREGQMLSLGGIIEACFHSGGDFIRMERAAGRARRLLGSADTVSRGTRAELLLALGTAAFFTGKLLPGIDALERSLALFRSLGDHFHQISAAIYLAPCALYHGDFRLAREAVRKGFEAQQEAPEEQGGEAALHLVQAMTDLFEGDFASPQASLDACAILAEVHGLESIEFLMLIIGGWVRLARGEHREAERLFKECRQRGELSQKAFFSVSASHLLAIVHLFEGRLGDAKRESDEALAVRSTGQSTLFRGIYLIISGAVHLELGRLARAERDLLTALALLQQSGAAQQEANARLMLARLSRRRGRPDEARRHLREGFSIGLERGFTYYAPLTAVQLRELAEDAVENGICVNYCASLLERLRSGRPAPSIRIFCFGGFRVERNGAPLREREWKSRRSKALVKLLATGPKEGRSRDVLLEVLWQHGSEEGRPELFRNLLHRSRRTLDPPGRSTLDRSSILQDGHRFALNSDIVWTDVDAFLSAVEEARRARTRGDEREVLASYELALELYAGDLLPDDSLEGLAAAREELRILCIEALDRSAEACESLGDRKRPIVLYERMFSFDPCNDKACRWLMQRHSAGGERNRAIRIYERHELAVRQELDMEPDERTRRVYRSIIEE